MAERAEPKMESVIHIFLILLGGRQVDEAMTERLVGAIALFPCVEQVSISVSYGAFQKTAEGEVSEGEVCGAES